MDTLNSNKSRGYGITILITLIFVLSFALIFIYLKLFNFGFSANHQNWGEFGCFFASIVSLWTLAGLFYGFVQTEKTIKKSNSLPVCLDFLSMIRSKKFIDNSNYIKEHLKLDEKGKIVYDVSNKKLQDAIRDYCSAMNNVAVMVVHNLIEEDFIIAYYGTEILLMYDLLQPFIYSKRKKLSVNMNKNSLFHAIPSDDRKLIASAFKLDYAHFEILAIRIRERGYYIVDEFTKFIAKDNRKAHKSVEIRFSKWWKKFCYNLYKNNCGKGINL